MNIARHGTAHHVQKLVAKFRWCKRLQDLQNANEQHRSREVSYRYDEDGSLVLNCRLTPEQGALVMKALAMAMER